MIIAKKTFSFFLKEKVLSENEPQNPKNLKRMLRKYLSSNAWVAIFKNTNFS